MSITTSEFDTQYAALTRGVGFVDFEGRTQLELTGTDRASFLHNLTTNAVRDLPIGSGCEAFILNVKGHVVGHVFMFAGPNSHIVETVAGQAAALLAHLDRYLIREDVQLHDRSMEWAEIFLSGPQAELLLLNMNLPVPQDRLAHTATQIAAISVWIRRVDLAGPCGFMIAFCRDAFIDVEAAVMAAGAIRCGADVFETARIEYGTPFFGQDISPENLPQEIDRTPQAISFIKGCYLGQETVARIDALGHVNRLLRGVKYTGDTIPEPSNNLRLCDKVVGQVTSACWSPRLAAPLAIGYVRRENSNPGETLEAPTGTAEIVSLPLSD